MDLFPQIDIKLKENNDCHHIIDSSDINNIQLMISLFYGLDILTYFDEKHFGLKN